MALVLVIEDDATQRFAAKFSLEKAGHAVIEALDGIEGLAQARARLPDVVVCDVLMPRMDGHEFLAALRADPDITAIPVLLVTSLAERADMRRGMKSGADDYLTKPFRFAELVEAVQGLIGKRIQRESQAARSALADLEAAMESQKHELSLRYEVQLLGELNARWVQKERANVQRRYADAVLLCVRVFDAALPTAPSFSESDAVRAAYTHARDQLALFGALQVLPVGNDLVAVFVQDEDAATADDAVTATAQALRACAALARTAHVQAMARGAVSLVQVTDALHGGPDVQLVGGEAFKEALALRDKAAARGWRVVASATMHDELARVDASGGLECIDDPDGMFLRLA